MPRNKNLKRLVRERMSKTGESYVTALAEVRARAPVVPHPFWRRQPRPEERKLKALLIRLFDRLGCNLSPDPPVAREWARPAFLVQPAAGAPCYLDLAVAPSGREGRAGAGRGHLVEVQALFGGALVTTAAVAETLFVPSREARRVVYAQVPQLPVAVAASRPAEVLVDPDEPYVIAVQVDSWSDIDAGVVELWTGSGGPRLHVSAVLVVQIADEAPPEARLYHHPEPRRPLTASPLLRLPQAVWSQGRYLHGQGEPLSALLALSARG